MKIKKVEEFLTFEEVYKEKIKVLEKLHKASDSMNFLAKRYWQVKCSSNKYLEYLAQLDKRIGEIEKYYFKRGI